MSDNTTETSNGEAPEVTHKLNNTVSRKVAEAAVKTLTAVAQKIQLAYLTIGCFVLDLVKDEGGTQKAMCERLSSESPFDRFTASTLSTYATWAKKFRALSPEEQMVALGQTVQDKFLAALGYNNGANPDSIEVTTGEGSGGTTQTDDAAKFDKKVDKVLGSIDRLAGRKAKSDIEIPDNLNRDAAIKALKGAVEKMLADSRYRVADADNADDGAEEEANEVPAEAAAEAN